MRTMTGLVEFLFGTGNVHVIGWDGSDYYEEATLTGPTNMLAGLNIGDCDSDGQNEVKGCEILGEPVRNSSGSM